MSTRREHDLLGDRDIPIDAYYGVHTLRAIENFPISGTKISIYPDLVAALASIKLAAAKSSLSAALRRVAVMAEERNKPVKLAISPASLKVTASSQELGEAEEILEVEYAGEEIVIGFNSRYLLEAMGALEKDKVVFEIKDAQSPGVIKSVEDEGYCCVIMPMRI